MHVALPCLSMFTVFEKLHTHIKISKQAFILQYMYKCTFVAHTVYSNCYLDLHCEPCSVSDCIDCRLHTGCKCKNLCWPSGLNLQRCIQNVGWSWKGRDSRCLCNTHSAYLHVYVYVIVGLLHVHSVHVSGG